MIRDLISRVDQKRAQVCGKGCFLPGYDQNWIQLDRQSLLKHVDKVNRNI